MSEAPALKRGLSILAYLRDNPDADSNELSSRLNIPPASLSRLTETLVNEDFLRVRCNGGWSIGNALRYVAFSTYDRDPVTIQVCLGVGVQPSFVMNSSMNAEYCGE